LKRLEISVNKKDLKKGIKEDSADEYKAEIMAE